MGKAITIKLVPKDKTKIYKPAHDYADLYVLMNTLHLNSVNEAIEEETKAVSELELQQHKAQESINKNTEEESTLNILLNSLESINKSVKKQNYTDTSEIIDYNKILEESDLLKSSKLKKIDPNSLSEDFKITLTLINENLEAINKRKTILHNNNNNLLHYILKIETLKENINSSITDIDAVEVALRSLEIR